MKLKSLPMIYNVDKLRIYDKNRLVAEIYTGAHSLVWYLQEDERTKNLLFRTVDEMTIVCEGCLGLLVVLEIFLK